MMTKMNNKEIRTLTSPIEIRAKEEEEGKHYIVGYALRFNAYSDNLGGFIETIEPDALKDADLSDVRALINHDPSQVLGRSKAGTLKLEVDDFGLRYEIALPDTTYARDLMNSMERGDIDNSSFGFTLDHENDGDEWKYDEKREVYVRSIKRIKSVVDVSVVTYPAYTQAESLVAQRSLEHYKHELEKAMKQKQIDIELELF
jgi:uncharacterized protein